MTSPHPTLAALCAITIFLPGCAARPYAPPSAPTTPGTSGPATIVPSDAITTPSLYKAYYVGQIIDPTHPELMYRPGVVYRQELPERWNRNPAATRGAVAGVISAVADPASLAPFSAEQQQLIAQQRQALELLADDNAQLRAAVKPADETAPDAKDAPREGTTPESEASPATAQPEAVAAAKAADDLPASPEKFDFNKALTPNSDGAIVLSPELLEQIDRNEPNPFVRRHQLETQFRDLQIAVTGTAPGPRPTATVNGRLLNNGDAWEGFKVVGIARDSIYLFRAPFLLQIPLAREHPVTVRIPQ